MSLSPFKTIKCDNINNLYRTLFYCGTQFLLLFLINYVLMYRIDISIKG